MSAPSSQPGRHERPVDHVAQIAGLVVERHLPVLQHAEIEQIVEQPRKPQGLVMDDARIPLALVGTQRLAVAQDLAEGADRSHGRAQFVADLAQEGVLLVAERRQFLVGVAQLPRRAGKLSDLASSCAEYSMICAVSSATRIRSSTETEAPPTIWPSIACAVAAPTEPGQLALQPLEEIRRRIGKEARAPLPADLPLEKRLRLGRAKDALRHHQQVLGLGRAVAPAAVCLRCERR